jgi:hypothetical protein
MAIDLEGVRPFPKPNLDTRSSNLDIDDNGRVTIGEVSRFRGPPLLEVAEPNTPQVDNFDVNGDGLVTVPDITKRLQQLSDQAIYRQVSRREQSAEFLEVQQNSIENGLLVDITV